MLTKILLWTFLILTLCFITIFALIMFEAIAEIKYNTKFSKWWRKNVLDTQQEQNEIEIK